MLKARGRYEDNPMLNNIIRIASIANGKLLENKLIWKNKEQIKPTTIKLLMMFYRVSPFELNLLNKKFPKLLEIVEVRLAIIPSIPIYF